ncbi:DnaB-like helicase C-terminal domain-containing protein [Carnobacterium maltaromaticum]|uniref:DnaB-like helicase C-terminal domain-containing protein n=1 Tax=Carnobacterium maltaromaticum TaxID=2751 RepID=UPI00026C8A49|nr:DnaB-like helicase C-terminal domain-containing protein [Carnobacterium maltaromaticum]
MTLKDERELLSSLIFEPSTIKYLDVDKKWFVGTKNKELLNVLQIISGDYENLDQLLVVIREHNPATTITDEWLEDLEGEVVTSAFTEKYIQNIKVEFLKAEVIRLSDKYAAFPTPYALNKLGNALDDLRKAESIKDDGAISDSLTEITDRFYNDPEPGITTYKSVDSILGGGLKSGVLLTIGARPSMGKTTFGVNMACQAMQYNDNLVIDYFSLEMSRLQMLDKFVACLTEINSYKIKNSKTSTTDKEKEKILSEVEYLRKQDIRVHDKVFSIDGICRMIRKRRTEAKNKPYVAFIDYLGLIDYSNKSMPKQAQISEITRMLKMLTNELEIPIVLFSQLNREAAKRNQGSQTSSDKIPVLSDLRDSGSIEQDSNAVFFIHRDNLAEVKTKIIVAKNREGNVASLNFNFYGNQDTFKEEF